MRACCLITMIVLLNCPVHAGGPEFVAGASFFDPTIKGVPVLGRRASSATSQIKVISAPPCWDQTRTLSSLQRLECGTRSPPRRF